MTWFRLIYLQCDAPDCTAGYLAQSHDEGMRVTREKASRKGWRMWESRDYCPKHSAAGIPGTRIRALAEDETGN